MSFKTSIQQRILDNVFYNNTTVEVDENILNSIASIEYVNTEVQTINNDITNINNTLTNLQNQITTLSNNINTLQNEIVRTTGSIFISVSSVPPAYSLLCDGTSYLVSDYRELFNVIGYAYGGSGTNFNVPNLLSRYLLGANGILNNVPASNLISGNGTTGALNDYQITGASWLYNGSTLPQFPILQVVPPHTHTITDNGHQHATGDVSYGGFAPSTTEFINTTFTVGQTSNTSLSYTNIQINNNGSNIQQTDPLSNISGVNITPPFFAVYFYINT